MNMTISPLSIAVADEVRRRQDAAGLSNRQLAARIGVSHPYVGARLNHDAAFTLEDVDHIAVVFDTTAYELMTAAVAHAPNRLRVMIGPPHRDDG